MSVRTTDQKNAMQSAGLAEAEVGADAGNVAVADAAASGDHFASVGADKASVTLFRRLWASAPGPASAGGGGGGAACSLVEVVPLSGRTHQIRRVRRSAWPM